MRSLRVQANTPSIGLPARSRAIDTRSWAAVVTPSYWGETRTRPGVPLAPLRYGERMDHVEWRERRARLPGRQLRRHRGRSDRPRGVLRLHGRAPDGPAERRADEGDRLAGEQPPRRARAGRRARPAPVPGRRAVASLAWLLPDLDRHGHGPRLRD